MSTVMLLLVQELQEQENSSELEVKFGNDIFGCYLG